MKQTKKQIAFTGTVEYREYLHQCALNRKIKVQTMLELAVRAYIKETATSKDGIEPANESGPVPLPKRRSGN